MKRIKIIGTGSFLPEKVLTNFDLEKMVDTTDEWIMKRSGIRERHIASENQATSDLGFEAAKQAIENAKIDKNTIDCIIFGTVTPDTLFPSTAIYVQKALGIPGIPVFDISAACSGFIYGLAIAQGFINSGAYKRILVMGGETLSKVTNWEDRSTCVLFGDGVGAAVVEESNDDSGIISIYLGADGNMENLLCQPAGGSRIPATEESVKNKLHTIHMDGNEVYKHAVNTMAQAATKALELAGISGNDVTHFIPHQANIRIMETTAKFVDIPREKVFVNIDRTANTSAGSIAIALDEMNRKGMLKKGDIILIDAFGAGFTWGSAVIRW
ncbi:MAG: ketoacyl-ACP synthase III [bacterium]|nr:ketoacyl-ACP synthase III [bacterium]